MTFVGCWISRSLQKGSSNSSTSSFFSSNAGGGSSPGLLETSSSQSDLSHAWLSKKASSSSLSAKEKIGYIVYYPIYLGIYYIYLFYFYVIIVV